MGVWVWVCTRTYLVNVGRLEAGRLGLDYHTHLSVSHSVNQSIHPSNGGGRASGGMRTVTFLGGDSQFSRPFIRPILLLCDKVASTGTEYAPVALAFGMVIQNRCLSITEGGHICSYSMISYSIHRLHMVYSKCMGMTDTSKLICDSGNRFSCFCAV